MAPPGGDPHGGDVSAASPYAREATLAWCSTANSPWRLARTTRGKSPFVRGPVSYRRVPLPADHGTA